MSLLYVGCAALLVLVGVMAFMRRDHKVELVVTYPHSAPSAVWRLLTDHAAEPEWLPVFGSVTREAALGGHDVWTHTSPNLKFSFTVMTVSMIPERRYERLLLRDRQPRHQSWDGRWIYELESTGGGTRLTITEFGWTDGFPFFLMQRVIGAPSDFLRLYAERLGSALHDTADIQVLRSH